MSALASFPVQTNVNRSIEIDSMSVLDALQQNYYSFAWWVSFEVLEVSLQNAFVFNRSDLRSAILSCSPPLQATITSEASLRLDDGSIISASPETITNALLALNESHQTFSMQFFGTDGASPSPRPLIDSTRSPFSLPPST